MGFNSAFKGLNECGMAGRIWERCAGEVRNGEIHKLQYSPHTINITLYSILFVTSCRWRSAVWGTPTRYTSRQETATTAVR